MSAAHEAHEAKDAAGDHDFDGEPTRVLPPDEPRTPGWVPALGLLLFLTVLIAFLIRSKDDAGTGEPAAPKAEAAAQPARPVVPAAAPGLPAGGPPARPAPAASGSAALPQLSPDQIQQIRKAIEQRTRQPGAPPAAPGAAPAPDPHAGHNH
jgi:hypothetical protein